MYAELYLRTRLFRRALALICIGTPTSVHGAITATAATVPNTSNAAASRLSVEYSVNTNAPVAESNAPPAPNERTFRPELKTFTFFLYTTTSAGEKYSPASEMLIGWLSDVKI